MSNAKQKIRNPWDTNEQSIQIHYKKEKSSSDNPVNLEQLILELQSRVSVLERNAPQTKPIQADSVEEVIAQILKELKAFQDKSEGRVRLQYYFSEEDRHFDVIGRIKDFDLEARHRLYNELPKWTQMFESLGWEVRLIVVAESDEFGTDYDLKNV